jgi:hypothetical protein
MRQLTGLPKSAEMGIPMAQLADAQISLRRNAKY